MLNEHEWWRYAGGWTQEPEVYVLRIPKAASSALTSAFQNVAFVPTHYYPLIFAPEGKLVFAVMRDPLERFRSAFDQFTTWPKRHLLERFSTIDDFVAAGPKEWTSSDWGCGYTPSSWWLKSVGFVRERGAIVLDYRTFSEDLVRMGLPRPGRSHSSVRRGTILSQRSRDTLREYYSDDYRLMEGLWS